MKKRIWIVLALLIVVVVIAIIGVLKVNRHYDETSPLKHLPNDAALVLRIRSVNHLQQALADTDYGADFGTAVNLAELDSAFVDFIDLLGFSQLEETSAGDREFFAALVNDSLKTNAEWVFSVRINNYIEGRRALASLQESEALSVSDTLVHGYKVLSIKAGDEHCYLTLKGGCLFASPSLEGIEAVTATGRSRALFYDKDFSTLERTASSSADVSLFVNCASADSLKLSRMGSWAEFDIECNGKSIEASGFMQVAAGDFVSTLATKQSAALTIDARVPSCAPIFMSYSPGKRGIADESFAQYLEKRGIADKYRKAKEFLVLRKKADIEEQMASVFACSVALFSFSEQFDTDQLCLVLGSENGTISQASLNALLGTLRGEETPAQVDALTPVPNVNVPVYEAFSDDDNMFFLSEMFPAVPHKFYIRFENTLLFADRVDVLRRTLYEILLNRTLSNDADFRNFRQTFSADNTFFFYCSSASACRYLADFEQAKQIDIVRQKAVGNFYALGLQVSSLGGRPYLSVGTYYEPSRIETPPTLWQSRLDTAVVGRPFAVVNHNTQEIEYLVQDASDKLYLINSKGLVLWKRQMDGPIIGNVTQIDYYQNRKLQYLFATADNIHLIDRNGNNTAKFPIKLQQKAVSGATYLDYGNPREFRIFVACNDKMIRLYDRECMNIQGWEMKQTEGEVHGSIDHWVTGNKDYLILSDDYRSYIVNRRGNERVPLHAMAPNANSRNYVVRANTPQSAFVTSTADGKFASIAVRDGKITSTPILDEGESEHHFLALNRQNTRFVFVSKSHIVVVNDEGRVLSSTPIYLASASWVDVLPDGNIAIWDKDENLGYIYTTTGKLVDGFPIPAASPFVVTKNDGVTNIVVVARDGSICSYLK